MQKFTLLIGNKNYSSWSFRPWLAMKMFNIPFEEKLFRLYEPGSTEQLVKWSPSSRVPVLIEGDLRVWDSLAICEYLQERFPEKALWPRDPQKRAIARSISSEMHSGFMEMRKNLSMNIQKRVENFFIPEGAAKDIRRVRNIWTDCLTRSNSHGGFLFGDFSMADAFYAPVVFRFESYGVHVSPQEREYMKRIQSLPPVQEWVKAALSEKPIEGMP